MIPFMDDKLKEECGVFGVYNNDDFNTAELAYYGLYALQHRGQESAGIAVNDHGTIIYHKEMGMVSEIFDPIVLNHLKGSVAVAHVRYSTAGDSLRENAQPLVLKYTKGHMALAHNGNLTNAITIRKELEEQGTLFQTTTDSEVIAALLARKRIKYDGLEQALQEVMGIIKGAYALLVMTPHKLIAARDPLGMRPLCIGKKENSYVVASESTAFDAIGAELVRDVEPGEIIVIDEKGLKSIHTQKKCQSSLCLFEYIYFARPDSVMDGKEIYSSRFMAGRVLAKEYPVEADIVIGVPDSGLAAARGFAFESGIPYGEGFIKNRYVGRTFIQPSQEMREQGVHLKLNPLRSSVNGKRVVMIDDSIVRGTTSGKIVQLLKKAGATEVHLRISSPPVKYPCYFGIDTPERKNLIASSHTIEEICELIGADSLGFISKEGILDKPIKGANCGFCTACFDGEYPIQLVDLEEDK
ncbi:amidophosphoribosyltransferase [Vallitalea okinawensis]|uniref:amidophosphoribosyltransferase n=1 Tax=Vallitalea okinawensis TaxID=2078660 RepID=UPI000CFCA151|nr:amidophosphoribosyltransferase [Vallitalea okinawensis]